MSTISARHRVFSDYERTTKYERTGNEVDSKRDRQCKKTKRTGNEVDHRQRDSDNFGFRKISCRPNFPNLPKAKPASSGGADQLTRKPVTELVARSIK
jgi:hypothetical protein